MLSKLKNKMEEDKPSVNALVKCPEIGCLPSFLMYCLFQAQTNTYSLKAISDSFILTGYNFTL